MRIVITEESVRGSAFEWFNRGAVQGRMSCGNEGSGTVTTANTVSKTFQHVTTRKAKPDQRHRPRVHTPPLSGRCIDRGDPALLLTEVLMIDQD